MIFMLETNGKQMQKSITQTNIKNILLSVLNIN